MILFEERQKFDQPWLWTLLIAAGVLVAVSSWPDLSGGHYLPHIPGILLYLAVVCAMAAVTLRTRLYADRLEIGFHPFSRRIIPKRDIQRAYVREYAPLGEYGGWGYRTGKSGTAYNMSGDRGLQLELTNGKRVLIGTQNPEDLQRAVDRWLAA